MVSTFRPGGARLILPQSYIQVAEAPRGVLSFNAETITLLAAMSSQPDVTRQKLINKTIADLKTAGIWSLLDEIWFLAAHTSQAALLGWKRYKDATTVSSPTFTTDRGFAGNGTSSYVNSNFVPSTDGVNFTTNNAGFGVYSRTDSNPAGSSDFGAQHSTSSRRNVIFIRNSGSLAWRVNQDVSTTAVATSDSLGFYAADRVAASGTDCIDIYHNGSLLSASNPNSNASPAYAMYIGAMNTAGTAQNFSSREYACAFVGASLTSGQQTSLYTIVQAYMTAVGANV